MSKAIMVVDFPEHCTADCPLYFKCCELKGFYCKRPETCILMPIPERRTIQTTDSNYDRGYSQAVNDFIDQLEKADIEQEKGRKQ